MYIHMHTQTYTHEEVILKVVNQWSFFFILTERLCNYVLYVLLTNNHEHDHFNEKMKLKKFTEKDEYKY